MSVSQVKKLEVLGISKEQKQGFLAEVITSTGPCAEGPLQNIFNKMTSLYEYFIKSKDFIKKKKKNLFLFLLFCKDLKILLPLISLAKIHSN